MIHIGGEASRNDLEILANPLRKIIQAQAGAKKWLADALANDAFPSRLVTPGDKRIWLQKVIK